MILDEIVEKRKINIAKQKQIKSLAMLKQEAEALPQNRDFPLEKALTKQDINFICEVKKASPSKGIIAQDFPYLTIAKEYELAGASAISVLTEPDYFLGEDKYLQDIVDIERAKQSIADMILFDAYVKDSAGGTGKSFNWDLLKDFTGEFILAGGINKQNIIRAIRTTRPYIVDISSGIEKDNHKDENEVKMISELLRKVG